MIQESPVDHGAMAPWLCHPVAYPGIAFGPARVGLDVNVCSGSKTFGSGDTTLLRIMRHGPGDVELHATTKAIIDVLVKGEVPVGPSNSIFLSGGVGPNLPRTGPDADE